MSSTDIDVVTDTAPAIDYNVMSVKVREALQRAFGPNAAVRTDAGETGHVYVRIVSDRFDGLGERAKQDMIWEGLRQDLKDEADAVALVLAFGIDQI